MKKTTKFLTLGILVLAISMHSCSKDGTDGPQGSQGPAGTTGMDGVDGVDGINGTNGVDGTNGTDGSDGVDGKDGKDGKDGNANVIYSNWLAPNWNFEDKPKSKMMRIPITEITRNELTNRTLVYMYMSQWGDPSVYTIPSSGRWSNVWYSFTFGSTIASWEGIMVSLVSTANVDLTEYQYTAPRGNRFRYVLVPQSLNTAKLDYSDYEAVKSFYNLPD